MFSSRPRHDIKRIVVCVDGTWYNADGKEGHGTGNVSNTFRVFASIKQGIFEQNGKKVKQVAKYFPGVGVKTNIVGKYSDGYTGDGCKEIIRDVYQYCCAEVTSPNDELWFFGFSRGAYVVRAVSALFRDMATLEKQNTNQFHKDYKIAVDFLNAKQKKQITSRKGELHAFLTEKMREGPVIQFLGLFDTVKQATGDVDFDLSYTKSIRRVRQALAMNEDRAPYSPEIYDTASRPGWEPESIIQAWFMGWHTDIGGGAKHDGLSLYPLQWMLTECQKHDLVLEHKPTQWINEKAQTEHPPSLVLPNVISESGKRLSVIKAEISDTASIHSDASQEQLTAFQEWKFSYKSGIQIDFYDLRQSHRHGDLQKWQSKKLRKRGHEEKATHGVKLNPPEGMMTVLSRRPRPVFGAKGLRGYNPGESYGTIIHPSVYFLLETYPNLGIREALQNFEANLDTFRTELKSLQHGDFFPWMLSRTLKTRYDQVRILICGRSGVGKSTLLNRIFGVDLTDVSLDTRGTHDINQGFESDQYPGVIIHDSEGFESGDSHRVQAFEEFLKKRSSTSAKSQQLHAVWICNEMDTSRPIETSMELVLEAIVKHAPDLPVFLIGTKKDKFLRTETDLSREEMRQLEAGQASDEVREISETCEREKRESWQKRLGIDCPKANQVLAIKLMFVSRDDRESVKALMQNNLEMLFSESLRSGMVAAQIVDPDLKIALAIDETVRLLRTAVTAASAGAGFVIFNSISTPSYSRLLCSTILRCFGLSSTSGTGNREEEVDFIMSSIVWSNLGAFMAQSMATAIGNAPLIITTPLFQAPAAARMIIKCACDLIIILDRASQVGGKQVTRQQLRQASLEFVKPIAENPAKSKIDAALIRDGDSLRKLVHRRVNDLIPAVSVLAVKIYTKRQIETIRTGIKQIVANHQMRLPEGHDTADGSGGSLAYTRSEDLESLPDTLLGSAEDEEDLKELKDLKV